MPVSLTILIVSGVFIASGVYMMLERTLSRIVFGFVLLGNGVNLMFLVAIGAPANPPFHESAPQETLADPLPMAMVLTAIVIALALTGFGMALSYRAWQVFGHDEVPDDVEDRRVAQRSRRMYAKARRDRATAVGAEADEDAPELDYLADDDDISRDINSDDDVAPDETESDDIDDNDTDGTGQGGTQ